MKSFKSALITVLFAVAATTVAAQDGRGTKDEAVAMANAAIAYVQKAGPEQAYKDFTASGGEWHKKDLYVFVNRGDGLTMAHGGNPKLVGKNMWDLKDQDGKLFIQDMHAVTSKGGSGWVDYSWVNPETKKIAPKAAFVRAIPGTDAYVGVGIYR